MLTPISPRQEVQEDLAAFVLFAGVFGKHTLGKGISKTGKPYRSIEANGLSIEIFAPTFIRTNGSIFKSDTEVKRYLFDNFVRASI